MKYLIFILLYPFLASAQTPLPQLVDSLRFVRDMPYICEGGSGCGDSHFWNVVRQKQAIVPFLIEKISDTTEIEVFVPNFGGYYSIGDVAYTAMTEIIHGIPTFKLLGVKFDKHGCGYCAYWNHVRENPLQRLKFQKKVRQWYERNKNHLTWVNSNGRWDQTPNKGYFEFRR